MLAGGALSALFASSAQGSNPVAAVVVDSADQGRCIPDGRHKPMYREQHVKLSRSSFKFDQHNAFVDAERDSIDEILATPFGEQLLPHKAIPPQASALFEPDSLRPETCKFSQRIALSNAVASDVELFQ